MGAVSPAGLVSQDVAPLYDYTRLRQVTKTTLYAPDVDATMIVLGSTQDLSVIRSREGLSVRRRRGGGGAVLLQPGDVWIDWWIPSNDERWDLDVRDSAYRCGRWWLQALKSRSDGDFRIHEGSTDVDPNFAVACFAGKGPGEVFLSERKVVGITQWRVREGTLLSSVLHARASGELVDFLVAPPEGLDTALQHHTLESLGISETASLVRDLANFSGPVEVQRAPLSH